MKHANDKFCTITFSRSEILYSISNLSWTEGDALAAEDERQRHIMQDVCDDGNASRVTDILDLAYFEVVDMLYPYSKQGMEQGKCDAGARDANDVRYVIQLRLPDSFSVTTINLLDRLAQEYIVCRVLSDWMSIAYPEGSVKWTGKMQDAEKKIRRCKNSRRQPVRLKMRPF